MNTTPHVAIIDDDPDLLLATAQHLRLSGFEVLTFADAADALAQLPADYPGAVLSDIRMPGMDGLTLFRHLRERDPSLPVILLTGHGTIDMAVQAIQEGAYDFLTKPYAPERLLTAARHATTQRRLSLENQRLAQALQQQTDGPLLLGESSAMTRLRETLRHIASADADVLIEGETGTGKEVVATLLHRWSRRAAHRLVAVNCGALPESIIESELFGHEAGAFTGAQKRRTGLIEYASQGTLLLDEIESMPLSAQTRLLRVLEQRQVQPLGSNAARDVDLRVIAASKSDLSDPALRTQFRADLYYRLNVITLKLPPLRERREDIPLLFAHFCALAEKKYDKTAPAPSTATLEHLALHDWPGNVRELAHYAERHVLGLLHAQARTEPDSELTLPARMERYEALLIRQTLAAHHGSVKATIEELGIPRKTFYDKLQRHGIQRQHYIASEV